MATHRPEDKCGTSSKRDPESSSSASPLVARLVEPPRGPFDALLGQLAAEQMEHLDAANRYDRAGDTAGNAHAELKAARICREHYEAVMALQAGRLVDPSPLSQKLEDATRFMVEAAKLRHLCQIVVDAYGDDDRIEEFIAAREALRAALLVPTRDT